jgi:hypothetical protein
MKSYVEVVAEDRRLALLRILARAPGYAANESVLHVALRGLGHLVSRDTIRTDLAWLDEQGLVGLTLVVEVTVAELTRRGADVAEGLAVVPGVKRPSPRS